MFSITYVPAEYLEEYKAGLEQTAEDVFSEARWVLHPDLPPALTGGSLGMDSQGFFPFPKFLGQGSSRPA